MSWRAGAAVAPLVLLSFASDANAHRPADASAWWAGLGQPSTGGSADGVLALRNTPSGRVRVPGGTFVMGSTPAQMAHAIQLCEREVLATVCHAERFIAMVRAEGNAHPVTLSSFAIDRTEVTVADYARCVSAGACAQAELGGDARFTRADFPVTHVRWSDAHDYCRWTGGRLPTEAEWEYVARGPDGREFPWGNAYNPHLANHGSWADDRTDGTDGYVGLAPVGSFPDGATPLGVLDMAGNAAEWVADVFELDKFGDPVGYADEAVVNPPPKTAGGGPHIVRGGSFEDGATWLRATSRDYDILPRPPWVGFRCAEDVR
jgi:formylglycine-generating enzyme required for sulfatase activity